MYLNVSITHIPIEYGAVELDSMQQEAQPKQKQHNGSKTETSESSKRTA